MVLTTTIVPSLESVKVSRLRVLPILSGQQPDPTNSEMIQIVSDRVEELRPSKETSVSLEQSSEFPSSDEN